MPPTYTLPADLLQAIVHHLNTQPAGIVRGMLNAVEAECLRQDQAASPMPALPAREPA